ncbi:hypothetical protein [Empedobacter brevis]
MGFNINSFPHVIRYLYIPEVGEVKRFYLEFEIYEHNICVISFCQKNKGNDKTRYRLRNKIVNSKKSKESSYKGGQLIYVFNQIMEICLNEFTTNHCFVFCGSNDLNQVEEYNDRISTYVNFINRKLPYFETDWFYQGTTYLNTFMFHHKESFINNEEAKLFFERYNLKIKELVERGEV